MERAVPSCSEPVSMAVLGYGVKRNATRFQRDTCPKTTGPEVVRTVSTSVRATGSDTVAVDGIRHSASPRWIIVSEYCLGTGTAGVDRIRSTVNRIRPAPRGSYSSCYSQDERDDSEDDEDDDEPLGDAHAQSGDPAGTCDPSDHCQDQKEDRKSDEVSSELERDLCGLVDDGSGEFHTGPLVATPLVSR